MGDATKEWAPKKSAQRVRSWPPTWISDPGETTLPSDVGPRSFDWRAHELDPQSSWRPPDWRWQLSRILRSNPKLIGEYRQCRDASCIQIERFQNELFGCRELEDVLGVRTRWPGIWEARQIHHGPNRLLKAELEARILAEEDEGRIRDRLGISSEVMDWYQRCYFDVAGRLEDQCWVRTAVLGQAFMNLQVSDYATVWKLYGYIGGPDVLTLVIDSLYRPLWNRMQRKDVPWSLAQEILLLEVKACVAIKCLPVEGNQALILRMEFELDRLERRRETDGDKATPAMKANLEAFLSGVPWDLRLPN